tara:strand:+ start:518 stop:787 length:270 start_codon:yes stop_codon:yes gene_type:complete
MTMTKKEMENKLTELQAREAVWQKEKAQIIAEAQEIQKAHNRRLMYLRLMEKFANDMDGTLNQLKSDISEVNASFAQEDQPAEATGDEL